VAKKRRPHWRGAQTPAEQGVAPRRRSASNTLPYLCLSFPLFAVYSAAEQKMGRRVPVVEQILSANDQLAAANRARLDAAGVWAVNLMASPGAGKTSLIARTVPALRDELRIGAVDGDLASSIDAERIAALGVPAVQISTGGACHLDAAMLQGALPQLPLDEPSIDAERIAALGVPAVQISTGGACHLDAAMLQGALPQLPLDELDLLIVENVGNLVCPASFQLGTHTSVLIASVPEGDDKPYKYPPMYRGVDALVLNKIDVLEAFDFDVDYFRRGVEALNPGVAFFPLSCRTGEGLDAWLDWLRSQVEKRKESL